MAAAYSPHPEAPLGIDLPCDLETGAFQEDVWARWLEHDPMRLVERHADALRSLRLLYLDCGTEDSLMSGPNQRFAALLREKKIPHEYRELPGDHNWAYWDQQVPEVLQLAAQKMRLPRGESRRPQRRRAKRTNRGERRGIR